MQKYATQLHNKTAAMIEGHTDRTMFLVLSAFVVVSFAMYLFFVGTTILNIVDRKSLENENRSLGSKVSELELNYLSETNKIDLKLAYSLGFKDAGATTFAARDAGGKALSVAKPD